MAESTSSSSTQQSSGTSGGNGSSQRTGGGFVDRMRDSATSQLSAQKNRATDGLGSVARAVRSSTQQLRDQNQETAAGFVEQIANQIDRLSQGLRQKDIGDLVNDAQSLARRQPAVFIASAFAVGLMAARFFKSSSSSASSSYRSGARPRSYPNVGPQLSRSTASSGSAASASPTSTASSTGAPAGSSSPSANSPKPGSPSSTSASRGRSGQIERR